MFISPCVFAHLCEHDATLCRGTHNVAVTHTSYGLEDWTRVQLLNHIVKSVDFVTVSDAVDAATLYPFCSGLLEKSNHLLHFFLGHFMCLSVADGISSVALSLDPTNVGFLIPTTKFLYRNYLRFAFFAALIAASRMSRSLKDLVIAQVVALSNLLNFFREVFALPTYCNDSL